MFLKQSSVHIDSAALVLEQNKKCMPVITRNCTLPVHSLVSKQELENITAPITSSQANSNILLRSRIHTRISQKKQHNFRLPIPRSQANSIILSRSRIHTRILQKKLNHNNMTAVRRRDDSLVVFRSR